MSQSALPVSTETSGSLTFTLENFLTDEAGVERLGERHRFMNWDGPILTDSGGFQVFSLAGSNKIDDDGVTFQSHIDGSSHRFTPELSIGESPDLMQKMARHTAPPLPRGRPRYLMGVGRPFLAKMNSTSADLNRSNYCILTAIIRHM
jgi:queuine/archaeosine tRNA-ribosyltransferase